MKETHNEGVKESDGDVNEIAEENTLENIAQDDDGAKGNEEA